MIVINRNFISEETCKLLNLRIKSAKVTESSQDKQLLLTCPSLYNQHVFTLRTKE